MSIFRYKRVMELLEEVQAAKLPPPTMARAIRQSAGVSQARLASELGVHRVTLARWERGACTPAGAVRIRYADLLRQLREAAAA